MDSFIYSIITLRVPIMASAQLINCIVCNEPVCGVLTGPDKIAGCYQSLTRASRSSAIEGEALGLRIRHIRFC